MLSIQGLGKKHGQAVAEVCSMLRRALFSSCTSSCNLKLCSYPTFGLQLLKNKFKVSPLGQLFSVKGQTIGSWLMHGLVYLPLAADLGMA